MLPLGSVPVTRGRFGEGAGRIVLDDLMCSGNEDTLINCTRRQDIDLFDSNCDHSEDAGVICQGRADGDSL